MITRKLPHIIYILADDMGCGDVSCLNRESRIQTPHLDALAAGGMVFSDAHSNSAVCTPTRYGILTGRYCWRGPLKQGVLWGYSAPLIEPDRMTVASFLRQHGYRTACIGKWHLGLGWQPRPDHNGLHPPAGIRFDLPLSAGPHTVGFDYSFILPASLDMAPYCYIENGRVVDPPTEQVADSPRPAFWRAGWCSPGFQHENCLWDFTRQAEEVIDHHAAERPDRPLFMYLALPSPHTPHCARPQFRGTSGAGEYGDLVVETDWTVGRISDALRRNGMADDTLLVFTSDNGCDTRLGKLFEEYGHRGNHIYRGQKSDAWDGGHRIPFIASWPGRISSGGVCDRTICLTDLMATCAAIAGAALPDTAGEDSYNILPLLLGDAGHRPRPATVHHSIDGRFAIREGPWKLILCRGSGGWSMPEAATPADAPPVQLYHMLDDPQEQHNLSSAQPRLVAHLTGLLETFQREGRSVLRD